MTRQEKIQYIFDAWNAHKCKGWKSHKLMNKPTNDAISKRLNQGYSMEDLCKAFNNYAKVLLSRDYTWTQSWTLFQFLTRTKPDDRSMEQLHRWLEGEFYQDDYLTPSAKQRHIERERKKSELYQKKKDFVPVSAERKAELRANARNKG